MRIHSSSAYASTRATQLIFLHSATAMGACDTIFPLAGPLATRLLAAGQPTLGNREGRRPRSQALPWNPRKHRTVPSAPESLLQRHKLD